MDIRTILNLLRADGWYPVAQAGSHLQLQHPVKPGKTTVPHPRKDVKMKTVQSIERQSGVMLRKP